ncbi:MAG TPA: DUF2206 domain-containing protein [Methanotrichaceae archaeon]|nr:DUF2206 domain-containing protein [Methanotrichaceae archaeon]
MAVATIVLTDIAAFFDIPLLRQVLGFITLTLIPGIFILGILKLDKNIGVLDRAVLSIALSYSYLIFLGLAVNWLYPYLGYSRPLSSSSLVFTVSLSLIALGAFASQRGGLPALDFSFLRLSSREKALLIVPSILPLLSILGTYALNSKNDNSLLMALLFLIPAYAIFLSSIRRYAPERVYPITVLLTSISLVLIMGLRSDHLIGADIHNEYYLFTRTLNEGIWRYTSAEDPIFGLLEACLCISVLPAVYQAVLNMDPELLFKILFPVIFAIAPLAVYSLSRRILTGFPSMLAALFFMSQLVFLKAAYFPRTTAAILFFALSLLVVFHDGIDGHVKTALFAIFSLSCILSHYSTAYLFLITLILTWTATRFMLIYKALIGKISKDFDDSLRTRINMQMILLLSAMIFFWYDLATGGPFHFANEFILTIFRNLPELLRPESKGAGVALALGVGLDLKVIPQVLSFAFSWLTIVLLSIGVLSMVVSFIRRKGHISLSDGSWFDIKKFDEEFAVLSLTAYGSLVASVLLPYIGKGYGMDRIYMQMMTVLSPFFIIGGIQVGRCFSVACTHIKFPHIRCSHIRCSHLVLLSVLIPYFLCNTGAMHQLFGIHQAITLNSDGKVYDELYVHDQEAYAAKWIKSVSRVGTDVYSDFYGTNRLTSQGGIQFPIYLKGLIEENSSQGDGYIYIRYYGAVQRKLLDSSEKGHDITDYQWYLANRSLVYSNGGSEIYGPVGN